MADRSPLLKRSLPYIVALVSFAALSIAYFAPQFSGKEISMHDVIQYEGMSKEIADHIDTYGEDPQWTGAMFGGMPAQLIRMDYDSMVLKKFQRGLDFFGRPTSFIFLAMACFYLMLLLFGVNPWIGIIPSLAYGLSTYFFLIIGAGHITKMIALAYAPLMVGGMAYTFRGNMWLGGALTALFASLEISANHPQITYYFLFVMVALWINELVKAYKAKAMARFAKITGILAVAAILAVGSNYAPLHYINEYGKESMRGGSELAEGSKETGLELDYATAWSYGKAETFNLFIPNLMGGASDGGFSDDGPVAQSLTQYGARGIATQLPGYWGPQPITAGPTYLGAVVIFLCVLGLFMLKGRNKWWVVAVTVVAIFLAWGKNFLLFTEIFFNLVPGYNKFRTVAMILVIAQWSVPFIAALVLNKVWKDGFTKEELIRGVKRSMYVCGGIALLFLLFGGMLFSFEGASDTQMGLPDNVLSAMRSERASMLRMDSLRSLFFVILTAGTVLLFALKKIKKGAFAALLAILVCVDLIPVNLRFLPQSKFADKKENVLTPSQADLMILEDKTPGFRVLNTTVSPFNDATTSYFHRSVGGYHGAKLQRYQDVIDRYLATSDIGVYNMLNTRYFIAGDRLTGEVEAQFNPAANGAAWFVDEVIVSGTPFQELDALKLIDTRTQAVMDEHFAGLAGVGSPEGPSGVGYGEYILGGRASELRRDPYSDIIPFDSTSFIELVEYRSNYLKYEYTTPEKQLAVFSEIYYDKGWKAYVDGVEAPILRADYILRAMRLPAGTHTVEFRFRAENFDKISNITLIFSILIIVSVAGAAAGAFISNRKKKGQDAERPQAEA